MEEISVLKEQFLETVNRDKELYAKLYDKIFQYNLQEFSNEDFNQLIKSLNSISINSIEKYVSRTKSIYLYLCNEMKITPKKLYLIKPTKAYVDYNKLFSRTLDYDAYNWLLSVITYQTDDGAEWNFRDKVILRLAWEGLTSEEIKFIKNDDVIIEDQKAIVKLKNRQLIIDEEEFINDLYETKKQTLYYIPAWQTSEQYKGLNSTSYLIRSAVGKLKGDKPVFNVGQLFASAMCKVSYYNQYAGLDLESITIEDVKRSRIISMLQKNVPTSEIRRILGRQTEQDIEWLKEIANVLKQGQI